MAKESKFKRETKIGIGVIGALLVVFGIVLFYRIGGSDVSTADANTTPPQDAGKADTPPPEPTLVETGTTEASYAGPTTRQPAQQRWTPSSRSDDIDPSARRSYMPAAQTPDDSQYDNHRENVQATSSDRYGAYASQRSDARETVVQQHSPNAYPPTAQDDQFRRRDGHNAKQNTTDQLGHTIDGQHDTSGQAIAGDGEIGRDEFEPQEVADHRAAAQHAHPEPNSPIVSPEFGQHEVTPAERIAAHPAEQPAVEKTAVEQAAAEQTPIEQTPAEQTLPPARPASGKYTVMPNDNYSAIAKRVYGNAGYFKALAEYNRQAHPRIHNLQVDDEVLTPELTLLRDKYGILCPKMRTAAAPNRLATLVATTGPTRIYIVEEGDTIYDIAKYELGKASRWAEIIALNRALLGSDIHFVRPGMKLRLPDLAAAQQQQIQHPASRVVRQPDPNAPRVR